MDERIKDNYFIIVRLAMMIVVCVSCTITAFGEGNIGIIDKTGISVQIFLLISLYMAAIALKELMPPVRKRFFIAGAMAIVALLFMVGGRSFLLLFVFTLFEFMSTFNTISFGWYFAPALFFLIETPMGYVTTILSICFMAVIYLQHNFIVKDYEKRMMEDTVLEQGLKRDMREKEYAAKMELKRNVLQSENKILEERASLSQTLHDKLGHSINGSIYQLEGAKVLMEKDPEKAKGMIQAVIDQLRTGMDEIRAILRKERPQKKELAMLQLYKLCEDSNSKGVETELNVEGDVTILSEEIWEVILDNAFEAVSNSMKYAKCKHIDIHLVVMNKMVRCSISDDGIGCDNIEDGMGISGMKRRVRNVNGTLDFETTAGFSVTMLLPL